MYERNVPLSQIFISFIFNLVNCATDVETSFNQIELPVVSVIYYQITLLGHFLALLTIFTICYFGNILQAYFVVASSTTYLTNIIASLSLACFWSCKAANFLVVTNLSHRDSTFLRVIHIIPASTRFWSFSKSKTYYCEPVDIVECCHIMSLDRVAIGLSWFDYYYLFFLMQRYDFFLKNDSKNQNIFLKSVKIPRF